MRSNFEFPSSLGKKKKSDKSNGSRYLGKEANQSIGRNKVFLHDSCKINFFSTLDLIERKNGIFQGVCVRKCHTARALDLSTGKGPEHGPLRD